MTEYLGMTLFAGLSAAMNIIARTNNAPARNADRFCFPILNSSVTYSTTQPTTHHKLLAPSQRDLSSEPPMPRLGIVNQDTFKPLLRTKCGIYAARWVVP